MPNRLSVFGGEQINVTKGVEPFLVSVSLPPDDLKIRLSIASICQNIEWISQQGEGRSIFDSFSMISHGI